MTKNMNTLFKHKILAGAILCSALFAVSSCDDTDVMSDAPQETLYNVMMADNDLTEFIEVINHCGAHCADSLFNQSRVYTVWAPKNKTFNKDSLISEIKEGGKRDQVFHRFVMAHVANNLHAANGDMDAKILLLNGKFAELDGYRENGKLYYTFDGQTLEEVNRRTRNGFLHKLASPAEYKYNIWEYLSVDSRVDSVASYLYAFNDTTFNEFASTPGPIVNGVQTYIDSAFITSNVMLSSWSGVGLLDTEDSTYTVYVPSNDAWNEMHALAAKHFKYGEHRKPTKVTLEERDSLHNYYSRINLLKYMTYSENEQRYVKEPGMVMPAWRGRSVYDFRPEFSKDVLEENVIYSKELSNGTFKIVDKIPYNQFELWHDTIKIEGENTNFMKYKGAQSAERFLVSKIDLQADSTLAGVEISGGAYYMAGSNEGKQKSAVTLTAGIPNILSASYNVAFILVPNNFPKKPLSEVKPMSMEVTIKHAAQSKKLCSFEIKDYMVERVDTMFLEDEDGKPAVITVPFCEYYDGYQDLNTSADCNFTIEMKTERDKDNSHDPSIRLDAILLIPVEDPEE